MLIGNAGAELKEPHMNQIKTLVDKRLKEVVINFHPVKFCDRVLIMGQFNSWLPEIMQTYTSDQINLDTSLKGTYYYRVRLLVGYKYRYYFQINGEDFCIDENKDNEMSKFKRRTNVITVLKQKT